MQALSGISRTSHKLPLPLPRMRVDGDPGPRPDLSGRPAFSQRRVPWSAYRISERLAKGVQWRGSQAQVTQVMLFSPFLPSPCIVLLPFLSLSHSLSLSSSPPAPLGMHQQANSPTLFSPPPKSFGFAGPSSTWFRVVFFFFFPSSAYFPPPL